MPTFVRQWGPAILIGALMIGLTLLIGRFGRTLSVPVGRVDTVPDTVLVVGLPDTTPPKGLGRIIRRPVAVDQSISQGTPDTAVARRFARKVFEAESLRAVIRNLRQKGDQAGADSVERNAPPPILSPSAGKWDGKRLTLWITLSNGRLMQATARVRPTWTYTAGRGGLSDTVPLVVGATWLAATAREALKCTPRSAILSAGGALVDSDNRGRGALLGAAAGFLGCMLD